MTGRLLLIVTVIVVTSGTVCAETALPRPLQNVGFDQKLDSQLPLDLPFLDDHGKSIVLGDYFREKPVILVLAYYRCPMLCTLVLNGLVRGLTDVPFDAGRDFAVVVVSIDSRETPELAREKKQAYVARYGRIVRATAFISWSVRRHRSTPWQSRLGFDSPTMRSATSSPMPAASSC